MSPLTAETGPREARLAAFIEALVAELAPLERAHNEACWLANTTGEARHEEESARLAAELRRVFARRDAYALLREIEAGGPPADPLLARQLALLVNAHRGLQIPDAMIARQVRLEKTLESRFNNFRAVLDGEPVTDNRILEVLQRSDDPERCRRAWEAGKQIGREVERDLLDLVRLRNEGARALGFTDFYAMSLELDELDERELFALLDSLDRDTRPLWRAYRGRLDAARAARFGIALGGLRPWHFGDPFFQEAPAAGPSLDRFFEGRDVVALARDYFGAIGFDIAPLLARADLEERPGKSQHAFCMSVDRGADIRVLCNVRPNERWMSTLLHELGHAVYDDRVDRALPWLLRTPAHTLVTEASAMLFGRLSRNPAWLRTWAGADDAALARDAGSAARAVREQLLVMTRWELVMIHMERALYRDPEQDLRTLWWDLVERFQGIARPEGRHEPDWAAKMHFSAAPVYYQNYLLGEMLASQLQAHLLARQGGGDGERWSRYVASPAVGATLARDVYAAGRRWSWRELVARATGRPLEPGPFVDELAGSGAP